MIKQLLAMSIFSMASLNPFASPQPQPKADLTVLAKQKFSLADRYNVASVNKVFKDNILLTLHYLEGKDTNQPINWDIVTKPTTYSFTLDPKQTFAFHDSVLPQYKNSVVKTTNAHFDSTEGFTSDGYLVGDGVCHFASFINMTAKEAGLDVYAPTKHDFAKIPEVPEEYGTAIYDDPNNASTSSLQNLYVTNNHNKPVTFTFTYDTSDTLTVSIGEKS